MWSALNRANTSLRSQTANRIKVILRSTMSVSNGTLLKLRDETGGRLDLIQYEEYIMPVGFPSPENKLKLIKQLKHKDGDVLMCAFPKSGSHWVMNMINCLLSPMSVENTPSIKLPLMEAYVDAETDLQPSPRLFSSHLRFKRMPAEHVQKGKVILLLRNPKDIAVSFYYHMQKDGVLLSTLSWESYLNYFLDGPFLFGTYFDYLNSWQDALKTNKNLDIMVFYYEDFKRDCFRELHKLGAFLGVPLTDDTCQQIVNRCSMTRLKADVDDGKTYNPLHDKDGKQFLYRKGVVGDWKNHLTVEQNTKFDQTITAQLSDTMFKFQYEAVCPPHKL